MTIIIRSRGRNSRAMRKIQAKALALQPKAVLSLILVILFLISTVYQEKQTALASDATLPTISDNTLKVELVTKGLDFPTSMAFLHNNDLLVLEKSGLVRLVTNETLLDLPVANFSVNSQGERGLLGIAILNESNIGHSLNLTVSANSVNTSKVANVFIYLTESIGSETRNRVYSMQWNGSALINQVPILDLPGEAIPQHVGGKLLLDSHHNLYTVIGDIGDRRGMLQNVKNGPMPDNTSVILRVDTNGSYVEDNPFVNASNGEMKSIFAYGIRNSFGLALDPLTGILWDTENGLDGYDELNVVRPGFNSGWVKVMGPISMSNITENDLVNFTGSKYADPIFSWSRAVGVTGIEFLNSTGLGSKYANNIFVGDYNNGRLYFFEVNDTRTGIKFGDLQSGPFVADNSGRVSDVTFGEGFGRITDIKTGRDGFPYILSFDRGEIYRIVPRHS